MVNVHEVREKTREKLNILRLQKQNRTDSTEKNLKLINNLNLRHLVQPRGSTVEKSNYSRAATLAPSRNSSWADTNNRASYRANIINQKYEVRARGWTIDLDGNRDTYQVQPGQQNNFAQDIILMPNTLLSRNRQQSSLKSAVIFL